MSLNLEIEGEKGGQGKGREKEGEGRRSEERGGKERKGREREKRVIGWHVCMYVLSEPQKNVAVYF